MLGSAERANAQIIPDNTLGSEGSIVVPLDALTDRIDGGAQRGSNLFHSFQEFNIGAGRTIYFANPAAVQNIFSRVTGNNPSHLFGTLGVLGDANLFFLNPNGILFGPGARLDIRGSFIASTADRFVFPDGSQFSATNPQAAPLLTVDVKPPAVTLVFEGNSGAIVNAGNLAVDSGQNLTLIADSVTNTGSLVAPDGDVTIVSVPDAGEFPGIQFSASGQFLGVTSTVDLSSSSIVAPQSLSESVLSTASDFRVNGAFRFNTFAIYSSCHLTSLPEQSCQMGRGGRGSAELYDIGRGGMIAGPEAPLGNNVVPAEWLPLSAELELPVFNINVDLEREDGVARQPIPLPYRQEKLGG